MSALYFTVHCEFTKTGSLLLTVTQVKPSSTGIKANSFKHRRIPYVFCCFITCTSSTTVYGGRNAPKTGFLPVLCHFLFEFRTAPNWAAEFPSVNREWIVRLYTDESLSVGCQCTNRSLLTSPWPVVKMVMWSRGGRAHLTKPGWSKPHTHSTPN